MTSLFREPTAACVHELELEVRLCAEGEATLLERVPLDDPDALVEHVLARHGIPDAVLRDESTGALRPLGWIVPAPPSPATVGLAVATVVGTIATPAAYVELRPTCAGLGFRRDPALPRLLADAEVAARMADAGLVDAAGATVPQLWDAYWAAGQHGEDLGTYVHQLLSVHRRARSAGVLRLAAHAADVAGMIVHRTGAHDAAIELHRWAIGVYRRDGLTDDLIAALSALSHALWHDGRPEAAAVVGLEACELVRTSGLTDRRAWASTVTAYALADLGRTDEAQALVDGAGDPGDGLAPGWRHQLAAYVAAAAGDLPRAGDHVRAALSYGYGREGTQRDRESLLAESFDVAAAIARSAGDRTTTLMAEANATIARRRLPEPYTH